MKHLKRIEDTLKNSDIKINNEIIKKVTIFLGNNEIYDKIEYDELYDELEYIEIPFDMFLSIFGLSKKKYEQYLKDHEVYKFELDNLYIDRNEILKYTNKTCEQIKNKLSKFKIAGKDLIYSHLFGLIATHEHNIWLIC